MIAYFAPINLAKVASNSVTAATSSGFWRSVRRETAASAGLKLGLKRGMRPKYMWSARKLPGGGYELNKKLGPRDRRVRRDTRASESAWVRSRPEITSSAERAEAPAGQGARRENTEVCDRRSNAAQPDGSARECVGYFRTATLHCCHAPLRPAHGLPRNGRKH